MSVPQGFKLIALPNGFAKNDDQPKLSVVVTADLTQQTVEVPLEMDDWPSRVQAFAEGLRIHFLGSTNEITPRKPTAEVDATSSAIWRSVFPSSSHEEHFLADVTATTPTPTLDIPGMGMPKECPVIEVQELLKAHYTSGETRAQISLLDNRSGMGRPVPDEHVAVLEKVRAYHRVGAADNPVGEDNTMHSLIPKQPSFDFYERLALISQYPVLMRKLGLIIDLEFTPSEAVNYAAIGVAPAGSSPDSWTKYALRTKDKVFITAAADDSDIKSGVLDLNKRIVDQQSNEKVPAFDAVTVDTDSASFKLSAPNGNLPRPSLVTKGISIARRGIAQATWDAVHATGSELTADEVLRGLRVDVRYSRQGKNEKPSTWHSLCHRHVSHRYADKKTFDYDDEGFVSFASKFDKDGLHVHQSMFTWDGWSLCVPRPGKVLTSEGTYKDLANTTNKDTSITPPEKSIVNRGLARLRLGRDYDIRVRTVDLAGNSPDPAVCDPGETGVLRGVPFGRFEPIDAPVLIPREPLDVSPGETADRLVYRSYASTFGHLRSVERHILPPRVGARTAEWHGMFDGMDSDRSYDMIQNDQVNADQGSIRQLIEPRETCDVDYLPDPFAEVALFRFGGVREPVSFYINKQADWPDASSFRLSIDWRGFPEPPSPPDLSNPVLTVYVPPGETQVWKLSCMPEKTGALAAMGIHNWINEKKELLGKSGEHRELSFAATWLANAGDGHEALLCPTRDITFVHAVQRPLSVPEWPEDQRPRPKNRTSVDRQSGETTARLMSVLHNVCRKSTQRIDFVANWDEPDDEGADLKLHVKKSLSTKPLTVELIGTANVEVDSDKDFAGEHDFGDTKHRMVSYTAIATSRFREYFVQPTDDHTFFAVPGRALPVDVPSTAKPAAPNIAYIVPTFRWEKNKHRQTRKRVGGCLRVYLNRPWYSSGDDEKLGVVLADDRAKDSPHVTQWGADPTADKCEVVSCVGPSVGELPGCQVETSGTLDETGTTATICWYPVSYDSDRKLHFSDIEIRCAKPYYYPFVRLALVRYQPHSCSKDTMLSRVVLADYVQLMPDRTSAFTWKGNNTVELTISGPDAMTSRSDGKRENCMANRLEAILQSRRSVGFPTSDIWETEGDPVGLTFGKSTRIMLENPSQYAYRILVSEYQMFDTDKASRKREEGVDQKPRLVYSDVIEL